MKLTLKVFTHTPKPPRGTRPKSVTVAHLLDGDGIVASASVREGATASEIAEFKTAVIRLEAIAKAFA